MTQRCSKAIGVGRIAPNRGAGVRDSHSAKRGSHCSRFGDSAIRTEVALGFRLGLDGRDALVRWWRAYNV
jgi:hypothetical protein